MIDMAVFKQFQQAITHLGEMAKPEPIADEERVVRAKALMRRKTDRALALDLESCVNCGYCSEACHFYQSTGEAKYTPT
ncbi:MAG: (Fe-S)-binding protein, partial [Ramlibacter sp.]|nr:(Fe-S)-binding protein [Ramlibacter sp.]